MSTLDKAYKEIEGIIGSKYITEKDFMKAAYSRNVDPAFPDRWADMIVRPVSSEEVSAIVQVANWYQEEAEQTLLVVQLRKEEFS